MVFGPWIETFLWIRSLLPQWHPKAGFRIRRPKFNFITLHYMYLISMTILGSVIIYPSKNMAYVDALFFACGAATQSGLNTINVNDLYLYQQVTLMLIASVCNPIFINTFVVFVRLYWFEKRFQNVVIEAQRIRRTRTMTKAASRSRTKSEAKADHDADLEERGVGLRKIVVMHPDTRTIDEAQKELENHTIHQSGSDSNSSATANEKEKSKEELVQPPITRREITFADEVSRPDKHDLDMDRMPIRRGADQHIAFLERQRNPDGDDVLFIPGPRDFDRGQIPQQLKLERDGAPLQPARSAETFSGVAPDLNNQKEEELNGDDHPARGEGDGHSSPGYLWARARDAVLRPRGKSQGPSDNVDNTDTDNPDSQHLRNRGRTKTFASFMSSRSEERDPMPYLSYAPTVYRNSAFVGLSEQQREELGGIEYRALKTLAATLCLFYVGFQLFGLLALVPWIANASAYYQDVLEGDGVNKYWWGIFTAASMFNDLGFTLTPDSMTSFNAAIWPLISGSFLIVIGNTGFPCMLRFCIWVLSKVVRYGSPLWEEFKFLLDHPRRCFTLLFPSKATWWLFWILVVLNITDLILFIILDLEDPTVTSLSPGLRVLNGWFQAVSTRTAGFAIINLANLHPAIQVSYLIMMYISVFPIAISVRRTNVYEENSLGVYASQDDNDNADGEQSYVGTHLRRQLSFDLWYVFLGLFIIAIVEGGRLQNTNQYAFTLFSVLFEIVSAYGTVGLSLGYPGIDASFSAEFRTISKLVIIAMQLRGRHRGLPYALDKAVLLPSETLHQKEVAEANRRAQRRDSMRSSQMADDEIDPLSETGRVRSDMSVRNRHRGHDDAIQSPSRRDTWSSETGTQRSSGGIGRLLTSALSAGPTMKKRED